MLRKFPVSDAKTQATDFEGNAMDARLCTLHETAGGRMGVGIFEGRDGHFVFEYGHDEMVYVIEGKYRLENLVSGRSIVAERDDLVVIPKGTRLRATIIEPLRCLYVTSPAWTADGASNGAD